MKGVTITHNLSEMLKPVLKLRDPQEPLRIVRYDGCLEIERVTELRVDEMFPRPHHAFPSLKELLSFTAHPVIPDLEFGGEDTGIKVSIKREMLRDRIKHEKNHFYFEIGNCVLSVNVARIPSQTIREGKPVGIDFICDENPIQTWKGDNIHELFERVWKEVFVKNPGLEVVCDASLFHRFAAGNLEELISVERSGEWKAEMPCMKVKFYPALVIR